MTNVIVNVFVTRPYAPFRRRKQVAAQLRTICETRSPNAEILPSSAQFVCLCMCCVINK